MQDSSSSDVLEEEHASEDQSVREREKDGKQDFAARGDEKAKEGDEAREGGTGKKGEMDREEGREGSTGEERETKGGEEGTGKEGEMKERNAGKKGGTGEEGETKERDERREGGAEEERETKETDEGREGGTGEEDSMKERDEGREGGAEEEGETKEKDEGREGGTGEEDSMKERDEGREGGAEEEGETKEKDEGREGGTGEEDSMKERDEGREGGAEEERETKEKDEGREGGTGEEGKTKEKHEGREGGIGEEDSMKERDEGREGGAEEEGEAKERDEGREGVTGDERETKERDQGREGGRVEEDDMKERDEGRDGGTREEGETKERDEGREGGTREGERDDSSLAEGNKSPACTSSLSPQASSSDDQDSKDDMSETEILLDIPEKWTFKISEQEWKMLSPTKDCPTKIRKKYTDIMREHFAVTNPYCVLAFSGANRIRKRDSRKSKTPFWKGMATCKMRGCCRYFFVIEKQPVEAEKFVSVTVTRQGSPVHQSGDHQKVALKGETRNLVAKKVQELGAHTYYMQKLGAAPEDTLLAGNLSTCQSPEVLRQALTEINKAEKFHQNHLVDLFTTAELIRKLDSSNVFPGYIRQISVEPFFLHMSLQVNLEAVARAKGRTILHLDATGSLVRKLEGIFSELERKKILYYVLVLPHKTKGKMCLPVAEMVSSSHNTLTIASWLSRFVHDVRKLSRHRNMGFIIVTDFSWAQIHAAITAFNMTNLPDYFMKVYKILEGKMNQAEIENFSIIHLCAAHFMKMIADKAAHSVKNSKLRRFFLFCIARLIECTQLFSAKSLYRNMCIVFLVRQQTTATDKAIEELELAIKKQDDPDLIVEEIEPSEVKEIDIHQLAAPRIKEMSPFGKIFDRVKDQVLQEVQSLVPKQPSLENQYYCEHFEYFHDKYIHLFPFFSAIFLQPESLADPTDSEEPKQLTRLTNAEVEGWMAIVKRDIFRKKKNNEIGKFVRSLYYHHRGLGRQFQSVVPRQKGIKRKERSPVSEWSAKGAKQKKRSTAYFSASEPPRPTAKRRYTAEDNKSPKQFKAKLKRPTKEPAKLKRPTKEPEVHLI